MALLRFLGHPYFIAGPIVSGRGVGRTIGFPTLNLETPPEKLLPQGVFLVKAVSRSGKGRGAKNGPVMWGVCNIGTRPTFLKTSSVTVEVHLLSGKQRKRAKIVLLYLMKRLRSEKKFESVEQLKKAISFDILAARRAIPHFNGEF